MDWLVEFLDANETVILQETYVGIDSAASASSRVTRQLATDTRLVDVAGWHVYAIDPSDYGFI